jgi:hypothetical protein
MGCTRLSVLPVLRNCLCDQFHVRIDHELGYHREFVRGIGEREWISCQTLSLRAYAGSLDVWPLPMGIYRDEMYQKWNVPAIEIFRLMMATLPS